MCPGYDPHGRLTEISTEERTTCLDYYESHPAKAIYTRSPPAVDTFDPATRYTYNGDNQLELVTRPDGQVLDFVYDSAGRLQPLTAPHGDTAYA